MKRILWIVISCLTFLPIGWAEVLPRIDLQYQILDTDTFHVGTFRFVNDSDTISLGMKIRHRGATSLRYDKKAYAIKLTDSIGESVDTTFLGMRNDNYWILDAMAIDKARMRNRVGMDLWLEFSRKPWYYDLEPKIINGYRGKMVEVYVNDSAQGIYHFMERVDRKQLKLKKYSEKKGIQGTWYKAVKNVRSAAFYLPTWKPNDTIPTYDSWEIKYPDFEDGDPITWQPLYQMLQMVQRYGTSFSDSIAYYLDVPVFTDYVLFCQLLSARDNERKNVNLSFYQAGEKRGLFTPWDLDHSWGRQYDSSEEDPDWDMFQSHQLINRLTAYYHFQDTLKNRYNELRKSYFTIGHIDSLFAPYFELFARTGMDTIEQQIWSGHNGIHFDIASEQEYIHDWVEKRIAYLDSVYQYMPPEPPIPTDIETPNESVSRPQKVWINGHLYIRYQQKTYTLWGDPIPVCYDE